MEFVFFFFALAFGFAGGVFFAFRHQAKINAAVKTAERLKDVADQ